MQLPKALEIAGSQYYLDGGTTFLYCIDEEGKGHVVVLVQHVFHEETEGWQPGRLYFDDEIIEVRSKEEKHIIFLLEHSSIHYQNPAIGEVTGALESRLVQASDFENMLDKKQNEYLADYRDSIVNYVRSEEYIEFLQS